jgi:hypothetical protein
MEEKVVILSAVRIREADSYKSKAPYRLPNIGWEPRFHDHRVKQNRALKVTKVMAR